MSFVGALRRCIGTPSLAVRSASSRAAVNARPTAFDFLAGLIRTDETVGDTGIPGLSDIPIIGRLFGRTTTGRRVIAEIPAVRRSLVGEIEQSRRARLAYDPAAVHLIPAEAA